MQQPYEGYAPLDPNSKRQPALAQSPPEKLSDLISVEALQKVQDNFSAAIGVAMVIVDPHGVPLTKPSGFTPFCNTIRLSEKYRERCFHCDSVGGRIALSTGEPSIYKCHCGLVDFAAPIIMNGKYLGAVVGGQVKLTKESRPPALEDMSEIFETAHFWQEEPELARMHEEIGEIAYDRLRSAAFTYFNVASHFAEESYAKQISKELYDKNLSLMEESKKRAELEMSLREAELQALSYQVNPHFMFNVLNTISRQALIEGASETEQTVHAFADMMRYILKKSGSPFAPLATEIEHVRNYLYLQQLRLGDRFDVKMDVPDGFNDIQCPFMVIQPIVENSIHYAVEPKESGGLIDISAYGDDTDLIVDIVDNGDGFPQHRRQQALRGMSEGAGRRSIGIFNVDSRLRHFYGDDYGLEIVSPYHKGKGTMVRMRFPLAFDPCSALVPDMES